MRRYIALTMVLLLGLSGLPARPAAAAQLADVFSFGQALEQTAGIPYGETPVELQAKDAVLSGDARQDRDAAVMGGGSGIQWEIDVPRECRYQMQLEYKARAGRGIDMLLSLRVNGAPPYAEAQTIAVQRLFRSAGKIERDNNGNDLRPGQEEVFEWQTVRLKDFASFTDSYLEIKLSQGRSVIRLDVPDEGVEIRALKLVPPARLPAYAEAKSRYQAGDFSASRDELAIRQAEDAYRKSSTVMSPTSDFGDPGVVPAHPSKIRINTFGKGNWSSNGQWAEWNITVKKSGYYKLSFKYKQDAIRNFTVARSLQVNGETPFQEAQLLYFPYTSRFKMMTFCDERQNPCYVYLHEGENQIRLEAVLGYAGGVLSDVTDTVYQLNDLYRKIIMITGVYPDHNQDYFLDREIPGLMDTLRRSSARLGACIDILTDKNGAGGQDAFLADSKRLLDRLMKDPGEIPKQLEKLKQTTSSLAELCNMLGEQPLELDYLAASGENAQPPDAGTPFWQALRFYLRSIAASFTEDYNAVGNVYDETGGKKAVKVWLSYASGISGRDQMNVLKRLIDYEFSKTSGIPVNLSLVNSSLSLTQSMLSGSGPDVVLGLPKASAVLYAMRGGAADLSAMDGFGEVRDWFYDSSFIHYKYRGGVYALPETQTFQMLFYRADILDSLSLTPPETWDAFYESLFILQKNNYQIGLMESTALFDALLLQHGGNVYNKGLTATDLKTEEALAAFTQWTDLYSKYTLPVNFDAYNRFRSGEMPMVMMPYTFYSYLVVGAPEIRGKWKMAPIPGIRKNGVIDNVQAVDGTCTLMTGSAKNRDDGFAFMKWWVSAETQSAFGLDLELQMGAQMRYATANPEAFSRLPWKADERALLLGQWKKTSDMYNVPGSYMVYRNITNAFRRVVYYYENPREVLNRYRTAMDEELARKRKEYQAD